MSKLEGLNLPPFHSLAKEERNAIFIRVSGFCFFVVGHGVDARATTSQSRSDLGDWANRRIRLPEKGAKYKYGNPSMTRGQSVLLVFQGSRTRVAT